MIGGVRHERIDTSTDQRHATRPKLETTRPAMSSSRDLEAAVRSFSPRFSAPMDRPRPVCRAMEPYV